MTIQRVRCLWGNWPGSPGYTNLYTTIAVSSVAPINTFWDAIKTLLPSGVTIQTPNSGDLVAEATGTIQGVWTGSGGATVTGTGAGGYAGASGAVVEWLTGGIVAGRRVMGKTFLVPIIANSYESNGTLIPATVTTLSTAATNLQVAMGPTFVIWSRPFEPDPDRVPPDTRPARAGTSHPVVGSRVPDLAAIMRTRRT